MPGAARLLLRNTWVRWWPGPPILPACPPAPPWQAGQPCMAMVEASAEQVQSLRPPSVSPCCLPSGPGPPCYPTWGRGRMLQRCMATRVAPRGRTWQPQWDGRTACQWQLPFPTWGVHVPKVGRDSTRDRREAPACCSGCCCRPLRLTDLQCRPPPCPSRCPCVLGGMVVPGS